MPLDLPDRGDTDQRPLSRASYFTDDETVRGMEHEHLPLWAGFLRAVADVVSPGVRVMEFGCNRGGLLDVLARGHEGIWTAVRPSVAVGLDVNTPSMSALLADAAQATPSVLFTTASPGHFPGQFDLILSHEVVYLIPDLAGVFRELLTALAAGGWLCIATGCHRENPLYAGWRRALEREGVHAMDYGEADYESALRAAGFAAIGRRRLLLSELEYERWVAARASRAPNPDWFRDTGEERHYYTMVGKLILTARRGENRRAGGSRAAGDRGRAAGRDERTRS